MAKVVCKASLVAIALLWSLAVQADDLKRYVVEGSQAAEKAACVEPINLMRRQHMDFITHQRVSTVHQGIRATKYSLTGCVECHIHYNAEQVPTPIDQPDQFCGACHAFAAVDLNCFDCHAAVPNHGQDNAADGEKETLR